MAAGETGVLLTAALPFAEQAPAAAHLAGLFVLLDLELAKQALPHFYQIKYWPLEDDGLAKANLDRVIATEKEVGGIKPGKDPVTYEHLVDRGVWKEAEALRSK